MDFKCPSAKIAIYEATFWRFPTDYLKWLRKFSTSVGEQYLPTSHRLDGSIYVTQLPTIIGTSIRTIKSIAKTYYFCSHA